MEKLYTVEEYNELKQRLLNLRQSAVALQGSEYHSKIWDELRQVEEEFQNAKIVGNQSDKNIISKPEFLDIDNLEFMASYHADKKITK